MAILGDKKVAKSSTNYYTCEYCDYKCCELKDLERHLLRAKHSEVTLGDKKVAKSSTNIFVCDECNYKCSKRYNWEKHLLTAKHLKVTLGDKKVAKDIKCKNEMKYLCDYCNKVYTSRNGLWKHKQYCNASNMVDTTEKMKDKNTDKELIMTLMKDNIELKEMMFKMLERGTHNTTTTHTNSHNKAFNLNLFLNETCKEAMNISDFISSIKLNLDDLENTGRMGYIQGISNIIVKNLNNLEQHMRPLHCCDFKREILYIKENDKWEKEVEDKPILTKAIKSIANENIKQIQNWRNQHPDCTDSESRKNDLYLKIVGNSMNGMNEEEGQKNINKIISNIAKETIIQK